MDILSFKHVKDPTEATLEALELTVDEREFLEMILKDREHLEGEILKRWRRIMR